MADALASLGIQKGDRVATFLPNGLPTIVSFLAASIAGTAAPLNPGYREEEVSFYLEDTGAKLLLCPPDGAAEARAGGAVARRSRLFARNGQHRVTCGSPARPAERPPPRRRRTMSRWCCTPAAAPDAPSACRSCIETSPLPRTTSWPTTALSPDDVSLCVMPLFHVHGLVASTLSTLLSGGAVAVPGKFNALSFWRTVRDTNATWYSAVPTIHNLLLSRAGDERPAGAEGLRFIRSCSASLPPEMMDADGAGVRRPRARSLRHDRSLAPDGVESAAAGRSESRARSDREPASGSASWTKPATFSPPASAAKW